MALKPTAATYTLRVELDAVTPLIWRRIVVDENLSLGKLHHYIQAAMGWADAHPHEFEIHRNVFAIPNPERDPARALIDERCTRLSELVSVGEHFLYRYDFDDNWWHRLVVEHVSPGQEVPDGYVFVAAGERACPPEDVGGPSEYMAFVDAITKRSRTTQAEALLNWAGTDFEPERFDRQAANAALLRMAGNRWA